VLHSLPIILNIVLPNNLLMAFPQDGAMAMNTTVLNSLANILTIVVLNRLLVSCAWRGGSH